ncbi:shufflon system plasmid conjugative transfer pilus tip adhesin PilV [Croceitalea sp. MTPC5]|uniref:shufflon system plasmid conjugative transfer pilus tip adhesin PilV n=1 Tax=Croceitalea sp. MTPC5 TaxID=3056565 RepID=UPI0030D09848
MKQILFILMAVLITYSGFCQTQNYYNTTAGNGYGFRFWNGSESYKIHMGNTSEYKYGGVNDYSIKMNMNDDPDRGWVWGISGQTPIASLNTQGDFHFQGELYANHGWLRVKENRGILFQDHGGGFFMQDATWIRTYGNKSFYHNSGTMRTDGVFEVGPSGNRFRVMPDGKVGIGTTNPNTKLTVSNGSSSGSHHSFSDLTIEDDDNTMVNLLSPSNKVGYYGFSDADDSYVGGMHYEHSFDSMIFRVNNHAYDIVIVNNGNVGIGTNAPDSKLAVNGNIHAKEVKVDLIGWPDYVFKKDYDLPALEEVEKHIKEKGHLINIPSAKEVEENGLQLGEMNKLLLEKIEELTLYIIEQEKRIKILESK